MADLNESRSPAAGGRGAIVISIIVLMMFGGASWIALTRDLPKESEAILSILLGAMVAMATSVVSYWVGSSAGSARKDEDLRRARADAGPPAQG